MNNATARAIASVAVAAACCGIAFAAPAFASLTIIGLAGGIYLVWEGA